MDAEDAHSDLFDGIDDVDDDQEHTGEPLFTPEDRPRGLLSKTDREYLCGMKEYAQPQTDANRRQDIRERVANGMEDFVLLVLMLSAEERQKIFEELEAEAILEDVIAAMVAFAYLGLEKERPRFETCLERAVLQAENIDKLFQSAGRATDVDVSLDVEYNPDIDRLVGRLENGEDLTDAEIGALVKAGRMDPEHLDQLQESGKEFPGVYIGG